MNASFPEAWGYLRLIRTVLRVMVTIEPTFQWRDASHGGSMQARPPWPICLCYYSITSHVLIPTLS